MTKIDAPLPAALAGERLDRIVAMLADVPRSVAADLVVGGAVLVDGQARTRVPADRIDEGQVVVFEIPLPAVVEDVTADAAIDVAVVYEDEHLVVVDKPAGLVVHPGAGNPSGTLVHGLVHRFPEIGDVGQAERPGIVHRLDRDTSGLLVVARSVAAYDGLIASMQARAVTRRYRALVWGAVEAERGRIDAPIGRSAKEPTKMAVVVGGREACTTYEVVARFDQPVASTEVVCHLETGRTHQIRVHLQAIGHPVVGDPRYGGARQSLPCPRQFLHAEHLAFAHPVTGAHVAVDSPMPADLQAVLASIEAAAEADD